MKTLQKFGVDFESNFDLDRTLKFSKNLVLSNIL